MATTLQNLSDSLASTFHWFVLIPSIIFYQLVVHILLVTISILPLPHLFDILGLILIAEYSTM